MNAANLIGILAGILTTSAFLPQVVKTIRTKSTKDISLWMFAVTSTGIFLWLLYGILTRAVPVIIANAVSLPLCLTILIFKLRYR
jgi:MtN3 and saliva related transmembrane protein